MYIFLKIAKSYHGLRIRDNQWSHSSTWVTINSLERDIIECSRAVSAGVENVCEMVKFFLSCILVFDRASLNLR